MPARLGPDQPLQHDEVVGRPHHILAVVQRQLVLAGRVFGNDGFGRNALRLGGGFEQQNRPWNRDTAVGAALFGVGWGLCGVCPGPAIAGLGTGNLDLLWALAGIALGALVQGLRAK